LDCEVGKVEIFGEDNKEDCSDWVGWFDDADWSEGAGCDW